MNLTPTQKADELIEKFRPFAHSNFTYNDTGETEKATRCAIIAVDEILEMTVSRIVKWNGNTVGFVKVYSVYWQEVKTILTDRL